MQNCCPPSLSRLRSRAGCIRAEAPCQTGLSGYGGVPECNTQEVLIMCTQSVCSKWTVPLGGMGLQRLEESCADSASLVRVAEPPQDHPERRPRSPAPVEALLPGACCGCCACGAPSCASVAQSCVLVLVLCRHVLVVGVVLAGRTRSLWLPWDGRRQPRGREHSLWVDSCAWAGI